MSLAQDTFESMVELEGAIIGHEAGFVSDEQLVEFLTNCDEEDFEYLQQELDPEIVKDLGETLEEDLAGLLEEDVEAAYEVMKKKVIRGGKLVTKNLKRMSPAARRKLSVAAKKAGRLRKNKRLSPQTRRKIGKSLKVRHTRIAKPQPHQ